MMDDDTSVLRRLVHTLRRLQAHIRYDGLDDAGFFATEKRDDVYRFEYDRRFLLRSLESSGQSVNLLKAI